MKSTKTYNNNLGGFIKWNKDNPWNEGYAKEYHLLGKGTEKIFVELSQNEFAGEKACFTAVRYFDQEKQTFKNKFREDISEELIEQVNALTDLYADRMNVKHRNYLM